MIGRSRGPITVGYHVQSGLLHLLRWHLLHIAYILVPFNVIAVEKRTVKFSVKEDHKKEETKAGHVSHLVSAQKIPHIPSSKVILIVSTTTILDMAT